MSFAGRRGMMAAGATAIILGGIAMTGAAHAQECDTVVFSDPQWTDITSTNALTGVILEALGYEQKVETISVPVTFEMLGAGEVDVFQGDWMPAQQKFVDAAEKKGGIENLGVNLKGAKFTLAVPEYVAVEGIKSFADLGAHGEEFDHKIYGIEPGAPANQLIQKMIDAGDFGLEGWELVESSEQAMLAQAKRLERGKDWIVFLAWAPHPMNNQFDLTYLEGGDDYFGPNYGGADVYTLVRGDFAKACPNVGKLLDNVSFTLDMENTMMGLIINDGMAPNDAATKLLKEDPSVLDAWLEGVTTKDGGDGLAAVKDALGV